MSLIHRGGRVDPPSIVQPDSCPSVSYSYTPSLPPSTGFLSLFLPGLYLLRSFLVQSLGRAAKVKQVTKTPAINHRFDTSEPPPSFQASRGHKSNQNACPISGQRYVRAAPCCFFCAPFSVKLSGTLPAHSIVQPSVALLPLPLPLLLCIVISHAVEAALAGVGSHAPWFHGMGPSDRSFNRGGNAVAGDG